MSDECKRKFGVEELSSYHDFEKIICKDCGAPYSIHRGLDCPTEEEIAERSPVERGVMRPEIPEELYDGYAVYTGLDDEAKKYTTPKNVSDVLDSVVRLIKQRIGA